MNIVLLLSLLALGYQNASAQSPLQTFGSGVNQFSVDFVEIGNPGNAAASAVNKLSQTFNVGSVDYKFNLGKYEVSRNQIAKYNSLQSDQISMADLSSYSGNGLNRPASGISWNEAAKFLNWLNVSSGFHEAYKFDAAGKVQLWSSLESGYQARNPIRNSLAIYVIPNRDEWYKGAYGSPSGDWYLYPTGSNSAFSSVVSGTDSGTAVYVRSGPADVDNAGGLSAYGTMAQGGNVWEWNESSFDISDQSALSDKERRGGGWWDGPTYPYRTNANYFGEPTDTEYVNTGFRVAMVPEPSALSLCAVGLGALAMMRRRRS